MSFFPRSFITSDPSASFTPLFRLLDDFDSYNRGIGNNHHHRSHLKSFSPKFDVKELADCYELYGELPGIEQKNVEIEFAEQQTLTVRGRTERSYTSGTPPVGFIEATKATGAITEGESNGHKGHKATVEDEGAANKDTNAGTEGTKHHEQEAEEPQAKYWVSERSVGEFARSFSFPVRVDTDQVKASMKNGILSVTVPKAKKIESRKIAIS
jgi:HSP20 family molecular chaperone IbpA